MCATFPWMRLDHSAAQRSGKSAASARRGRPPKQPLAVADNVAPDAIPLNDGGGSALSSAATSATETTAESEAAVPPPVVIVDRIKARSTQEKRFQKIDPAGSHAVSFLSFVSLCRFEASSRVDSAPTDSLVDCLQVVHGVCLDCIPSLRMQIAWCSRRESTTPWLCIK